MTTDEMNGSTTISCLEDLSNELIYEIFEFLDNFHVYQALFNLNQRFQSLIIHSNLPIKINLPSIYKSDFKYYNNDIIKTNVDRINLLHLSDVYSYDFILMSMPKLSEFSRLETLILHNIQSEYLANILHQLSCLSSLSSLIITTVDAVNDENTIFRIFLLPALKYCKLSFEGWRRDNPLPIATNEYSPIEYLIITGHMYVHELSGLLSYVPHLRRLSVNSISESRHVWIPTLPSTLNDLTHISLNMKSVEFDFFEDLVINTFHSVEVLRLTLDYDVDHVYMDAKKWKELIVLYLPNLRVFDLEIDVPVSNIVEQQIIEAEINQFVSPFWSKHQWFFAHQFYKSRYGKRCIFYSTNPYRRKYYTLYEQVNDDIVLYHRESNVNSVKRVHIQSEENARQCTNYFSNTTELILTDVFSAKHLSVAAILSSIIPLKQLTKLVIKCDRFSIENLIKILYGSPKIHTLELQSMFYDKVNNNLSLINHNQDFQGICHKNIIKNVTCDATLTLNEIKLLVDLCPRIQYYTVNGFTNNLESITCFLLSKTNQNTRHLRSLCFSRVDNDYLEKIDVLIKTDTLLLDDYTLKMINFKLYLWR